MIKKIPTPNKPYKLPANCTITLADGSEINCCLKYTKDSNTEKRFAENSVAVQSVHIMLEQSVPANLSVNSRLKSQITNLDNSESKNCTLVITKIIQNPFKEATNKYGAILKGVIIQDEATTQVNTSNPFS